MISSDPFLTFFDFFSALEKKTGDSNSDLRKNGEIGKRPSRATRRLRNLIKPIHYEPIPSLHQTYALSVRVIRVPLDDEKVTTYLWYLNYAYYTKLDFKKIEEK